jgi:hypothetical protein
LYRGDLQKVKPAEQRRDQAQRSRTLLVSLAFIALSCCACSNFLRPTSEEAAKKANGDAVDELAAIEAARAEETDEVLATIRRMSEFLASRPALRYASLVRYDAIQHSGQKFEFGSRRELTFVAPDRVRMEAHHWDGGHQIITFDGKQLAAAAPQQGVYASIDYAGTAGEAFDYVNAEHGVASPLLDLVRRDLPDEIADQVLSARHIGTVTVAGATCDQLAVHAKHLDFQIFIRQGNEPFPVRLVIDYHGEEGRPQFRAQLVDWEVPSELPDPLFQYAPQAGAQRVEFPELMDLLFGRVEAEGEE